MVFQSYALYPHMTVADNMGFALKIAGMNKSEIRSRVEEAARILHLTPFLDRMGDRVAVLKDGLLARCDTPQRLYQQPADVFVAGFIGSPGMNIAEFKLDGTDAVNGRARVRLPTSRVSALGEEGTDRVVVGFHPRGRRSGERARRERLPRRRRARRGTRLRHLPLRDTGRRRRRHSDHRQGRRTESSLEGCGSTCASGPARNTTSRRPPAPRLSA
jgi:ABC-type sugar transport system ATPase subunit